jgi:hypothetical protein
MSTANPLAIPDWHLAEPQPPPAQVEPLAPAPAALPDDATGNGWNVRSTTAPLVDLSMLQPPLPEVAQWSTAPAAIPQRTTRTRRIAVRAGEFAAALTLLGVVLYGGWAGGNLRHLLGVGRNLSQPPAIGGMALLGAGASQPAGDAIRAGLAADAQQTVVGVYGTAGAAQALFVAAKGGTTETSAQIVAHLSGGGRVFDSAGAISPTIDGQQYQCGVLDGRDFGAAVACVWSDGDIDAVLLSFGATDLQATAGLAAKARAAAES